jgi:hypothetical protein
VQIVVNFIRKTSVISGFCVGSCQLNQTNVIDTQTQIDVQMLLVTSYLCRFVDFWSTSLSNRWLLLAINRSADGVCVCVRDLHVFLRGGKNFCNLRAW